MALRWIANGAVLGGTVLAAALLAPGASGSTVPQKKPIGPSVTLKFESYNASTDPLTLWATAYAKQVAKDSGGAVQIQIYPNSELVSQAGVATALETDSIPMGLSALNSIAPGAPSLTGLDLEDDPYETGGYAATRAVMQSLKVRGIVNAAMKGVNLEMIGSCVQGQNAIVSTIPQENLTEMKGVKTRVANTTSGASVSAYGADPVVIPIGSTYQAFLLHTADAALSNVPNDYGYDWYQVAKYINQVAFQWVDVNMFINTTALAQMNKAEQKIVVDDATNSAASCDSAEQKYDNTVLHAMEGAGATNTGFSSKAAQKAFDASFTTLAQQEDNASPLAQTLSKAFKQIVKQYPS